MVTNDTERGSWPRRTALEIRSTAPLLPVMAVVFAAYLVAGMAMPVLPLHVHQGLGLGAFVVGVVAGAQFAASLISRLWSGRHADTRGAKSAVVAGLLGAAGAGLLYLLSLYFLNVPGTSVTILLLGRALLGGAESFVVTGALSWGLALMGPQNTGKVMAWIGTALYAAFAVGAPIGSTFYGGHGFASIALATALLPAATLMLVLPRRPVASAPRARAAFASVASAVWLPGVGLAFGGVGFGAITTFIALLFPDRGWAPAWLALTAFSLAFIVGRMIFGHLPDRVGGARCALVCALIEAAGLALIWLTPWAVLAFVGAVFTGIGYSLVYPSFGVEAVRRAPPHSRGFAMGAYTAFFDLSLWVASPVLGLVAGAAGFGAVFLASALAVLFAAAIAARLMRTSAATETALTQPNGDRNESLGRDHRVARADHFGNRSRTTGGANDDFERPIQGNA